MIHQKLWHTSPRRYFKLKCSFEEQSHTCVTSQADLFKRVNYSVDDHGRNMLFTALDANNFSFLANVIPIVESNLLNEADTDGRSLLYRCCTHPSNSDEVDRLCVMLVNQGVALADCDKRGSTVFHSLVKGANCSRFKFVSNAITTRLLRDEVKALLNTKNVEGFTPLHVAVREDVCDILTLLVNDPLVDVNAGDFTYEFTALHMALNLNNSQAFLMLVKHERINVDVVAIYNITALHLAVVSRNYFAIVLLRERSARIDICTRGACFPVQEVQKRKLIAEDIADLVNIILKDPHALLTNHHIINFYYNKLRPQLAGNLTLLPTAPRNRLNVDAKAYALGDESCMYLLQIEPTQKASKHTQNKLIFYTLLRSAATIEDIIKALKQKAILF